MTPEQYRAERKRRGTQIEVAAMLGVDRMTVVRREGGNIAITQEAEIALLALPKKRKIVDS